jgi:hypothetical protein
LKIILNDLLGKIGALVLSEYSNGRSLKFTEPEKTYLNKKVCVTGKLVLYNDKPQIVVGEVKQIVLSN